MTTTLHNAIHPTVRISYKITNKTCFVCWTIYHIAAHHTCIVPLLCTVGDDLNLVTECPSQLRCQRHQWRRRLQGLKGMVLIITQRNIALWGIRYCLVVWEHDSVTYNHFPINHLSDQGVLWNKVHSLNVRSASEGRHNVTHQIDFWLHFVVFLCLFYGLLNNLPYP